MRNLQCNKDKIDEYKSRVKELVEKMTLEEKVTKCCKARNTIQVYIKAERQRTPNPQLKAFVKVELVAGQDKEITIDLPMKAFGLGDDQGRRVV